MKPSPILAPIKDERVQWVDCCKGICIVLVVYGHVAGGLDASGVLRAHSAFHAAWDWVYLFHIQAFFYLSGLFAKKAAALSFSHFLRGRLRVLFYPYLLWTAIMLVSQMVMGSFVNVPANWHRALRCFWEPYGVGLWFLYSLFLVSLLFESLRRWRTPTAVILTIGFTGYVLGQYFVFGFWYILDESMRQAIFFMIGGCFPAIVWAPFPGVRGPLLAAIGVGLLALMTLSHVVPLQPAVLFKLGRSLLGIAGVVFLAVALSRTAAGAFWTFLGTYSLEIYLAHPLWGTFSRGVLLRLGVQSPSVFVLSGMALGVGGGLAMALLSRRLAFPYLFRWPLKPKSAVGVPS